MANKSLHLIGYAYGGGGADPKTGDGPKVMQSSPYLLNSQINYLWDAMLMPSQQNKEIEQSITNICKELALTVSSVVRQKNPCVVIGGDHTCAIGTWSGVYDAYHSQGDVGLIWIDAHMDAHTPETSESGRIHGMPLAVILGAGNHDLVSILHDKPKCKPENVCLIGVRSFEGGEADFLKSQGIRIYYMDEVLKRGCKEVMEEAIAYVNKNTIGFGVSLDLDSIDPMDAPAVAVPEDRGIHSKDLLAALPTVFSDSRLIATEIVEFDPARDIDHKTEKMIVSLLELLNHVHN